MTAIHVDHGLRAGSADDAEVVRATAERFGARFEARTVEVALGPNVEARARAARYAALPPDVLTGHTADDQAETILLNLVRGAGLDGLRGMPRARRPLIQLRRSETHALCDEVGLTPVTDPMNASHALRRNRVRHELLPLLDAIACRDVMHGNRRAIGPGRIQRAAPCGPGYAPDRMTNTTHRMRRPSSACSQSLEATPSPRTSVADVVSPGHADGLRS